MKTNKPTQEAFLYLEDGTLLKGISYGSSGTTSGEICFSTSMTGYQETFTDPSYAGQILIMNTVHIGNYGVMDKEVESSKIHLRGIIGRNLETKYSRHQSQASLKDYLQQYHIMAISNIDTRWLVRHIRENGAMNVVLSTELKEASKLKTILTQTPNMSGQELASEVSTTSTFHLGDENAKRKIAVIDYGLKNNILEHLVKRDAYLKIFPAQARASDILDFMPDGVMLTNGPGDPASMHYATNTIQKILEHKIPLFGICLGHQLLCLSSGIPTYKLPFGHRGINHPVINLETQQSEITTQNHGFGVRKEDIDKCSYMTITHLNLNDNTVEGVRRNDIPAFSVQYHPEATPGPHDSHYLFDHFMQLIDNHKNKKS